MPNWCYSNLTVSGENSELEKFKKRAKAENTALSLNNLFPTPKELENTIARDEIDEELEKKYGASDWYEWRIDNWATKWDVIAEIKEEKESELVYGFDSAWMPPVYWLDVVSKDFSKLKFALEYYSPESDFMGLAVAENGIINHEHKKYYADDLSDYPGGCATYDSVEIIEGHEVPQRETIKS